MKAAVITGFGEVPKYTDFPDPVPADGEMLVDIKASVLENFDKGTASGKHYSSNQLYPKFPAVVGTDWNDGGWKDGRCRADKSSFWNICREGGGKLRYSYS